MKRGALPLSILCVLLVTSGIAGASTSAHLWSQGFGGVSNDNAYSVAVDGHGNILLAGSFSGTTNLGGGDLVSAGSVDIFLAKYDATGVHLWSRRYGGTGADYPTSVAVDGSNEIVLTGSFVGTVSFGAANLVSAGGYDVFLVKFDTNGIHLWSQRFGGTTTDYGHAVAVDNSGNVIATGLFEGTASFGGFNRTSAGLRDVFLVKCDAPGDIVWVQRFGGTAHDEGNALAVDKSGNILLAGDFNNSVSFGGSTLNSAGSTDVFLAKYDPDGLHLWSKRFGSTSVDIGTSLAVDDSKNVFLAGNFYGVVNFGGSNLTSAGGADIFLAKYNASGTHFWSQRFGAALTDQGNAVAVDASGNVLLTGTFKETVDFGGGDRVSAGGADGFLAKYSPAGIELFSRSMGNTRDDDAVAVAVDGLNDVLVTGDFEYNVDFGGGNRISAGSTDVFLARYGSSAGEPDILAIDDVGFDQGRRVSIEFARSGGDDATADLPVVAYEAYRRVDNTPYIAAYPPAGVPARELLDHGWTQVGSVAAHAQDAYGIEVPTLRDSTIAEGQYYSHFFIRAATEAPAAFFDSAVDSGYSVDNLAPGVPQHLAYTAGDLSWDESAAADFDFFTVYGANTDLFAAAAIVDYTISPAMDVAASPYPFYFVTATDFSGNEGKPARVFTSTGVGGTPKSYVLSVSNYPNPFNPGTTVSYTVPSRGAVTVSIYDTRGALVATLFDGERNAGAYSIEWDGRAQGGATVSTGIYFARIDHNGATRTKKMLLLK